jgi:pre-mRNA cleavage complex 2 protein Pcf11
MDDHLDMHFRQNRKANQNIGRGHSRSWFIGVEVSVRLLSSFQQFKGIFQDWIQDISGDRKGKGRVDGSGPLNAKASAAAENAKREAELQAQYVIVPRGDEAQVVSCPICKETLKSEFLEDDEDWVWKNAIKKDDRVRFYLSSLLCSNLNRGVDISCNLLCSGSFIDEQLCSEATH